MAPETETTGGLTAALRYPLFDAIKNRRSRRVSQGIQTIAAGALSYTSSELPMPLTELEEALLIWATGMTGFTMPDMPLQTQEGRPLLGTPMIELAGRSASSPDNAQATHFFLLNDTGTFLLRRQEPDQDTAIGELRFEDLLAAAEASKLRILDGRIDYPREFPYYVGRNRFVSNVPGSTVLVPVVDLTRQYINGLLYLLSQEDGSRPTPIDDWNFYRPAGVGRWVRSGFLNKQYPLPLGYFGTFRIHVEADLLQQNILLAIQSMGLGGWIHAAFPAPFLLGDPEFPTSRGLGFRFARPQRGLWQKARTPITPLPAWRDNPVGLDGVVEGLCPPYYPDMDAAVDALLAEKYSENAPYGSPQQLEHVFKPGLAEQFLGQAAHYDDRVVDCVKDVCNYIWETYGRFPAHVDAMHVPGTWVQAHHLDLKYYDSLYRSGYTEAQREHERLWHSAGSTA